MSHGWDKFLLHLNVIKEKQVGNVVYDQIRDDLAISKPREFQNICMYHMTGYRWSTAMSQCHDHAFASEKLVEKQYLTDKKRK